MHAIQASKTQNVRLLLQKGASVNIANVTGHSLRHWGRLDRLGYVHLSIAAGVKYTFFENHLGYKASILPHFCEQPNCKIACPLDKLCRQTLRNHLLNANPRSNLYCLVKCLPLPEPIKDFLMFDVGIDDYCSEPMEDTGDSRGWMDVERGLDDSSDEETIHVNRIG